MSQKIRLLIPEPKLDELEKLFAKQNRKRIGYTRAQVLNTTHLTGHEAAKDYIHWYNLNKFDHMPLITGVGKSEVTDPNTIPQIGLKYPELRPTPALPVDEASEPKVEDESPSTNTTEEEGSPPAANVDDGELPNPSEQSEDDAAKPAPRRPGGIFASIKELGEKPQPQLDSLHKQLRNARKLLLRKLLKDRTNDQLGHRLLKYHRKSTRLWVLQ